MKRIISWILCVTLLLGCVSPCIATAATPQYVLSDTTVRQGDIFTMDVAVSGNPGVISLRFRVIYDTAVLELQSVSDKQLMKGFTTPSPTITSPYTLRWADSLATTNNAAQGTVVTLTFKALQEISATTVSIEHGEARNATGSKIVFAGTEATVAVGAAVVGCSHTNTTVHPAVASTCKVQGNSRYTTCDDCGEVIAGSSAKLPLAAHTLTRHPHKEATHSGAGNIEYWTCNVCNGYFGDRDGTTVITQADTILSKIPHSYSASWSYNSSQHWHECSCGAKKDVADHRYTGDADAACDVCGFERAVSVVGVCVAVPNDNYDRPEETANEVNSRPKIDGKLDDATWTQATKFAFTQDSLQSGDGLLWSHLDGDGYVELPNDGNGEAYIGWDDEYIYFALEIEDVEHMNNYTMGYDLWRGDSLRLQISHDTTGMFDDSSRYELGFAYNAAQDRVLGYRWETSETGEFLRAGSSADMSKGAGADYYYYVGRDDNEYTTTYEIALKHEWLGGDGVESGNRFLLGFALHLYDERYSDGFFMEWAQGLVTGKTLSEAAIITCNGDCSHQYDNACDTDCNLCGAVRTTRHTVVVDKGFAPTCTAMGKTDGSHCGVCGEVIASRLIIPAKGHVYVNGETVCVVCGAADEEGLLGDVDGNSKIDSTDARLVLQYAVKKIGASALNIASADVDGSGKVDSTDARLILQYAVKKISTFPKG